MILNSIYQFFSRLTALQALLLGAFAVLGFAPFYVFPAPIFALIALVYLWAKTDSAKQRFKLGFCFGLGLYCVGIYWIYISLHDFGGMPWWFAGFCTFCLCAFMALFPALVGYFTARFGKLMLSAPVLWGLSDWIRSWIFTGFPWLTLGYSQVPHSPLAGYMPLVGVYGVSVITALLASSVAICMYAPQNKTYIRNAILICTFTIALGLVLKAAEWTTPIGKPISVALLQGNVAQSEKWSPEVALSTINSYIAMIKNSQADLIITPETALPVVSSQLDHKLVADLTANSKTQHLIVGIVEYQENSDAYFNSAIGFSDTSPQAYAKNHLVPFGEFIPLKQIFGWIYRDYLNIPLSDLSRGGTTQQPMDLAGQKVAVNICYEDVFGEEIIRQLPAATLLVNMSNDAWYGQSFAADQHMQFSQARALETGRMVLRSTNTGATAIIDPQGFVLTHAPHFTKTTLQGQAQGYAGATPYVRWGNWPFILFCFSAIAFVIKRKTK